MGKKLCLNCKKCFNMSYDDIQHSNCVCPECGNQATIITHRFRPPKKEDNRKWEVVAFLIENGFPYQHVSIYEPDRHGIQRFVSYGKYPENMIDAIEFVNRFKRQAIEPIGLKQK
ncbi:MAG: hypothetical protein EOO44_21955 [Flavobacterium sp.]|nr:MAG: hypothetical protein EOO44_21955 [Flavobacterium sp.]